jgi:predicted CopG family antitoxin
MATKTISIMDDAYMLLLRNKMKNESFSDVIRRSFEKKKDIMRHAGAWKDMSDDEVRELKENIKKIRESSALSLKKRIKSYDLS